MLDYQTLETFPKIFFLAAFEYWKFPYSYDDCKSNELS